MNAFPDPRRFILAQEYEDRWPGYIHQLHPDRFVEWGGQLYLSVDNDIADMINGSGST